MLLALVSSTGSVEATGGASAGRAARQETRAAGACSCAALSEAPDRSAVAWRGSPRTLPLDRVAAMLAPVLWFSADEPLIVEGELPLPHPHPCDRPSATGVVYYQLTKVRLRGSEHVTLPEQRDPEFLEKVAAFTIRYFFYYRHDYGVGAHVHDLEMLDQHVEVDHTSGECAELRVTTIIGFAHGTDWYSNELRVERDTRFPITVLVEEGKHASCPDRNADGIYTPGYDVNRRIHDAWGVRDVMGSGFLISSGFRASMAKARQDGYRVLPPEEVLACAVPQRLRSFDATTAALGRYELRPANTVSVCDEIPPSRSRLIGMMRGNRFGAEFEPDQYHHELLQELAEPLSGTKGLIPDVSARWDRGLGAALMLRGFDLREGYLVPRITWVEKNVSVEAVATRSAAQFFSWYIATGIGREYGRNGAEDATRAEWNFVGEAGAKFRVRLSGRQRFASLGYEFAGVRLGVRSTGFDRLQPIRLIVEVGAGVW